MKRIRMRKQPDYKSVQKVLYWIGERDEKLIDYHKQAIKRRKKIVHAFLRFKDAVELGPSSETIGKIKARIWYDDEEDTLVVATIFKPRKNSDPMGADSFILDMLNQTGLGEFMTDTGSGCSIFGKPVRDMTFREKPWKMKT